MNNRKLRRRGYELGTSRSDSIETNSVRQAWTKGLPFKFTAMTSAYLSEQTKYISNSDHLYRSILERVELDALLSEEPYNALLSADYEPLGSAFNEGDQQEIETVFFDAIADGELIAEDLWVKVSWLSFFKEDASIRFRFSFGVDFEEDVASDRVRQHHSAKLAEAIFQESVAITKNVELIEKLKNILATDSFEFVERIIYFNAPNGGAYLHHDRERGHAGVVYAQLTGETYWLALPRYKLVAHFLNFVTSCIEGKQDWPANIQDDMRSELSLLTQDEAELKNQLESFSNSAIIHLINETKAFVQSLIDHGFGIHMIPGDVLLLPQESEDHCCWHSVFCLGDEPGEALSFAIRAD